jgi:hypothetical protein
MAVPVQVANEEEAEPDEEKKADEKKKPLVERLVAWTPPPR